MSFEITEAMVQQYSSNITLLLQQKQSRLRRAVRVESIHAEFQYYDQIGPVEAQPKGGRHSDTPLMNTPHMRRRVSSSPYNWADLVDNTDKLRMLADPTGPYTMNAVMAFNRAVDQIIIDAFFDDAWTGKEGKTRVAFPTSQVIPAGGTGLTIDKLIATKKRFWQNEALGEMDEVPLYMAVTSTQLENLLKTTQVTNADYNTVKALVRGDVNSFMGFEFIRTERLAWNNNIRDCVAWVKDGMLLAVAEDITVKGGPRPDKNYSQQIYVEMDMGATRMDEKKVVKVQCAENV